MAQRISVTNAGSSNHDSWGRKMRMCKDWSSTHSLSYQRVAFAFGVFGMLEHCVAVIGSQESHGACSL